MKLLLVTNYAPDAQQSMLRFGALLERHCTARGWQVSTIAPEKSRLTSALGNVARGRGAKWLAYIDKYVRFPARLTRWVRAETAESDAVVHIVDHSNAVYVPRHITLPWVVTCHDLLAVRGALGEDTDCPASALGRQLQRAIVRGLGRASAIVADSTSTLHDVERLVPTSRSQVRQVVPLGLNHPYRKVSPSEAHERLRAFADISWDRPFLVHVGSNLRRKNKSGVLRVFARTATRWSGNLVFCGAELPADLRAEAAALGVADRVFCARTPDNAQLEAIYSLAHALLFPSRCEGFGWPVIEAQACGCPVICSDRTSLPEVGGDAALVHALEDEAGMAESVVKLTRTSLHASVVARGYVNLKRFETERMIDAYAAVYEELLTKSGAR